MATRYKVLKDGRIQLFVSHGSGKARVQKSKIIPEIKGRKRDKVKAIERILSEFERGVLESKDKKEIPTFGEYFETWIERKSEELSPKSIDNYKYRIGLALPTLKDYPLDKIDKTTLETSHKAIREHKKANGNNLSPYTIQGVYVSLRALFNDAVRDDLLDKSPMIGIKKPKATKTKKNYYDSEEAPKVLTFIISEPLRPRVAFLMAIIGGLRRGEIVGLNHDDFNHLDGTVRVARSYTLTDSGPILKTTKSDKVRYVSLPDLVMDLVLDLIKDNRELYPNNEPLFINANGERLYPSTLTHAWNDFKAKHNLSDVSLHGLRHTSASILISQGLDIETVSNRLGHSSKIVTLNNYSHLFDNKKDEIEAAFKRGLGQNTDENAKYMQNNENDKERKAK